MTKTWWHLCRVVFLGVRSRPLNALAWIALAIAIALTVSVQVSYPSDLLDEGEALAFPYQILGGAIPYRDVWMPYPPGMYALLAGLYFLFGHALLVGRLLMCFSQGSIVVLTNRLITGSWFRFSWIAVPALFVLTLPVFQLVAYPFLLGVPLLLAGFSLMEHRPQAAVVCFFLSSTLRLEFVPVGIGAFLVVAFLDLIVDRRALRNSQTLIYAVELAIMCVGFYGFLDIATKGYAYQDLVTDLLKIAPYRALPLAPPWFAQMDWVLLIAVHIMPCAAVVMALRNRLHHLAAANLALLPLVIEFYNRRDTFHLFALAALTVSWFLISSSRLTRVRSAQSHVATHNQAFTGAGIAICFWIVIAYNSVAANTLVRGLTLPFLHESSLWVSHGGRETISWSPGGARDTRQLLDFLDAQASRRQSIFVGNSTMSSTVFGDTELYYLVRLRAASRYQDFSPAMLDTLPIQKSVALDLRRCRWVILFRPEMLIEPASQRVGSHFLDEYIRLHFRRVLQNQSYTLLIHK